MAPLAIFGSLGMPEILVILVLVVFLFGARRIPEIAKGLGEGIRGFRTALKGDDTSGNASKPDNENSNSGGS